MGTFRLVLSLWKVGRPCASGLISEIRGGRVADTTSHALGSSECQHVGHGCAGTWVPGAANRQGLDG